MAAIELAVESVLGVGLQGGQMVRPAFQEQPFGGGPVPPPRVQKRQVHVSFRHVVQPVRLVREVRRRLLLDFQCLVIVLLRLLEPAGLVQQKAPAEVACRQALAELQSGREVRCQLLEDARGLVVVLLRLHGPARGT